MGSGDEAIVTGLWEAPAPSVACITLEELGIVSLTPLPYLQRCKGIASLTESLTRSCTGVQTQFPLGEATGTMVGTVGPFMADTPPQSGPCPVSLCPVTHLGQVVSELQL